MSTLTPSFQIVADIDRYKTVSLFRSLFLVNRFADFSGLSYFHIEFMFEIRFYQAAFLVLELHIDLNASSLSNTESPLGEKDLSKLSLLSWS